MHRTWLREILFACVLLIGVASVQATAVPPNVKVNSDTSSHRQNEEQMWVSPVDPDIVLAVWRDWQLGYRRVAIGVSTDGGFAWSDSLFSNTFDSLQTDPCLVGDRLGNVYATMMDHAFNGHHLITVFRSTDGGQSWSEPDSICPSKNGQIQDKPFTAVDRTGGDYDGYFYCAWARNDTHGDMRIMFVRSTDNCNTFGDTILLGSPNYCQGSELTNARPFFPMPIVDADGDVHVFWKSYFVNQSDCSFSAAVHHARSANGGADFDSYPEHFAFDIDFESSTLDGGVHAHAYGLGDCDISGGDYDNTIYIVATQWSDSGDADVTVLHSTDKGANWSDPKVVNDDPPNRDIDQFLPWLVVNEDGVVLVLFYDQRNDLCAHTKFDAYFSASFDGGETYITNMRVSDVSSDPNAVSLKGRGTFPLAEYIGMHANHDSINAIWTDLRNGNPDAYSARFALPFMKPRLYLPEKNDPNFYEYPDFKWSTCWHESDDSYRLELSTTRDFAAGTVTIFDSLLDNNYTPSSPLDSNGYFWRVKAFRTGGDSTAYSETYFFGSPDIPYVCGDADGSGVVDIDDVTLLARFIFGCDLPPDPYEAGDADCSDSVDIDDMVYLISFIFSGGNDPCDTDGDGVPDC